MARRYDEQMARRYDLGTWEIGPDETPATVEASVSSGDVELTVLVGEADVTETLTDAERETLTEKALDLDADDRSARREDAWHARVEWLRDSEVES